MIGLNKIGLNQVQLNRLRLNAPFPAYGKMAGGGGSGDGFPQLPGDVTRWHFGGLTNEMMAAMDDPRIEDADHKGRFLSFKNFAWGGMSGVGGYGDENHLTFYKFTFDDYVFIAIKAGVKHMNFTFRVTGLQPGNKLTLAFFGTTNTVYGTWDKDGIYTVNSAVVEVGKPVYFYNGYGSTRGEFTIEILPLYPGFILGDGVDDFAVTEKELNFEDTYTVYTAFIPFQVDPVRAMEMCGKDFKKDFYLYYSNNHIVYYTSGLNNYIPVRINQFHIIVCKRNKTNAVIKNLITGESKTFSVSELIDNPGVYYLWRYQRSGTSTAKSAIAGQTICNGYFSTDEDDEKVLDWYKKQYPWLFPDQAWTVTGKTNEDEDRATIANITGNGNDLVLSNFGFAEGSGYGLYAENYAGGRWVQSTDRADLTWTSYSVNITSVKVASTQLYYQSYPEQPSFTVSSYKIKVYGLKDGQTLSYKQVTSEGQQIYKISEDGIYTLPSFLFKANGDWYGFTLDKIQETCDITIEQIPEYEGYLVTDGVDDKITSSAFKMGKDWTVVGDWKFINDESKNAGIIKPSSLYVYNALNGVSIFINSGSIGNNIKENKGFNAICSNGRAYDRNWTEYSELKVEEVTKSNSELKIGASSNDTTYTRMAFKNFAIYPKVLSKDDCIKAYNYLQTLKAK
jgi:hypothetical protein